jgi:hypothetical protein
MHLPFSVPAAPAAPVSTVPWWMQPGIIPKARPVREVAPAPVHRPVRSSVRSMFRPPMPISKESI